MHFTITSADTGNGIDSKITVIKPKSKDFAILILVGLFSLGYEKR